MSLLQKSLGIIPAKAGIQPFRAFLVPGFRRGDGICEFCKSLICIAISVKYQFAFKAFLDGRVARILAILARSARGSSLNSGAWNFLMIGPLGPAKLCSRQTCNPQVTAADPQTCPGSYAAFSAIQRPADYQDSSGSRCGIPWRGNRIYIDRIAPTVRSFRQAYPYAGLYNSYIHAMPAANLKGK